jgi:fumarylpyruvate hydrolase
VGRIAYPMATRNLHHELELVVAIGKSGANVAAADAQGLVFGYAVGLDMTRRDLQNEMREKKRPWDIGKSFAQAAPMAPIHPVAMTGTLSRGEITLLVNGERRQHGDLSDMVWDVAHMLEFLSRLYRLEPGDLVFTGTPSGVGPVVAGDRLEGRIAGLTPLAIEIVAPVD